MTLERVIPEGEKFHAHLDICEQCRENPFDLCDEGAKLLISEAEKIADSALLNILKGKRHEA